MGRANNEAILKKLMKTYLKFDIKRSNFNTASSYYLDLQKCWNTYGVGAVECHDLAKTIDQAMDNDQQEFLEYRRVAKNYPTVINKLMLKNKTKYLKKGREQIGQPTFKPQGYPKDYPEI